MRMPDTGKMMAEQAPAVEDEAGSSDNTLTWSPGDFPETQKWQDGEEYTVSLRIRQTSPGQAEVLSLSSTGSTDEGEEGPEPSEEAGYTEPTNGNSYSANPAVARLMARK